MHDALTYAINGALFAVYNELGNIWPEEVYEQALQIELEAQGFCVERQKEFEVFYFDRRVGHYRIDLLVEDTVIIEIKAVPHTYPLHKAQLISYLKGFKKPLGILANFGDAKVEHATFPNRLDQNTPLQNHFDYDKIALPAKERIKELLFMANRVLVTLGVGYFHQIYRRAMYHELQTAGVEFDVIKGVTATYRGQHLSEKEVNFFRIGDLLFSAVAVQCVDDILLAKFRSYAVRLRCARGLLINFNATALDFRYIELQG